MAIAKNTAKQSYNTGTTTTVTSLDCTGSDRLVVAIVYTPVTTTAPTGVTFNTSESLAKIAEQQTTANPDGTAFNTTYWKLVAPTSTTANVVATFSGSTTAVVLAQ